MNEKLDLVESPCERMLAVANAIAERRRRFQGWSSLRFAALGLLAAPGDPDEVAEGLFARADSLSSRLPFWSGLRSDVRFCIAARLVAWGRSAPEFLGALEVCREHFRRHALPRSEVHEALACLVLMDQAPSGVPTAAQVARTAQVYAGMKQFHPFLTGRDDFAAAAVLAATGDSVEHISDRIEGFYHLLHDLRFRRGNQLQLATHLLYFAAGSDRMLASRFRLLFDAFEREGLWMYEGDYHEIALLASLDVPSVELVRRVLADRDRLRSELAPRPSPQQAFEFASATALLATATDGGIGGRTRTGLALTQVVALVQAQQVALVSAAIGGRAAGPSPN